MKPFYLACALISVCALSTHAMHDYESDSDSASVTSHQTSQDKTYHDALEKIAQEKYHSKLLFSTTRANRYATQAKTLSPDVQKILTQFKLGQPIQDVSSDSIQQIDEAIKQVQASPKGWFYHTGEHSSGLLEDLQNMKKTLTSHVPKATKDTAPTSNIKVQFEEPKIKKSLAQLKAKRQAQLQLEDSARQTRAAQRATAQPGKLEEYMHNEVFTDLDDPYNPKLQHTLVNDPKRIVLEKQLTTLQKEMEQLTEQEAPEDKIKALQQEIQTITQDLANHHEQLHSDALKHLDELQNKKADLKTSMTHLTHSAAQIVTDVDHNRLMIDGKPTTLPDLKQHLQKLNQTISTLKMDESYYQRLLAKSETPSTKKQLAAAQKELAPLKSEFNRLQKIYDVTVSRFSKSAQEELHNNQQEINKTASVGQYHYQKKEKYKALAKA